MNAAAVTSRLAFIGDQRVRYEVYLKWNAIVDISIDRYLMRGSLRLLKAGHVATHTTRKRLRGFFQRFFHTPN